MSNLQKRKQKSLEKKSFLSPLRKSTTSVIDEKQLAQVKISCLSEIIKRIAKRSPSVFLDEMQKVNKEIDQGYFKNSGRCH